MRADPPRRRRVVARRDARAPVERNDHDAHVAHVAHVADDAHDTHVEAIVGRTRRPPSGPVETVVVAVPARDEAPVIGACLDSVVAAAHALGAARVVVAVAADTCRDDTPAVAGRQRSAKVDVVVVEGRWRSAGGARAAAVTAALARAGGRRPASTWVANTDADCVVPADWLALQLDFAAAGADAVAGVVRLDASTPPPLQARFAAHYRVGSHDHGHVHGANLGVRADAYRTAGGWRSHTVLGEDHALWQRLARSGARLHQPSHLTVTTSSRTVSRVRGGFASSLARLARAQPVPRTA